MRLFILDDAQLERGFASDSDVEKSGLFLHETKPYWSASPSESISSSHSYLSSPLDESPATNEYSSRTRRPSHSVDGVLSDYRKGAERLSAALSKLGLQDDRNKLAHCNGGASRHSGANGAGQTLSGRQSDVQRGNRRVSQRRRLNRQNSDNDENSSEIEDERSKNSPNSDDAAVVYLACPYVKNDPVQYVRCTFRELKTISILKQHLGREHKLGRIYCTRCLEHFNKETELQTHRSSAICEVKSEDEHHTKYRQINKRLRDQNSEDVWFRIYRIIFPNSVDPASPYAGDESRKHLMFLFEMLGREHTKQIMGEVNSRRRHTIASETALQKGSMRLITDITDSLYGVAETDSEPRADEYEDHEHAVTSAAPDTIRNGNSAHRYNPGVYTDDSTLSRIPTHSNSVLPTLRRTSGTQFSSQIPILEDPDAESDFYSLSYSRLHDVRGIYGGPTQRRLNQIVNPTFRHSDLVPPASPWTIPASRPLTNPEGMQQVDMQQILEAEELLQAQENQLYSGVVVDPGHTDWSVPQQTINRRRRTRVDPSNRWPTNHRYSNSSPYGSFQ